MSKKLLRQIRPIDYYLQLSQIKLLVEGSSKEFVLKHLRTALDKVREAILQGKVNESDNIDSLVTSQITSNWKASLQSSLCYVINATGTLLHTNLGRAPLAKEALDAINLASFSYTNLEYELQTGKRGSRNSHCELQLKELLACEAAVVVNNCAAAVMLVLDEMAKGGEVIISRGELIEIGGAFRIPDVMKRSGAVLREVGTTNKTRLSDYETAINENTRLILRVHPSNYKIIGFSEKPELKDLVALANLYNLPVVEDLGSGALIDLSAYGINEPTAAASIKAGVSVITFSGDKMLGGPQAGIIAGRSEYIARIKRNPLMRALRVDKLCYSALSATLQLYRTGHWNKIPLLKMLALTPDELKVRCQRLMRKIRLLLSPNAELKIRIVPGYSIMGGGSAPETHIPTTLLALQTPEITSVEAKLRQHSPPVIARIEDNLLLFDLRTVLPMEETDLAKAIAFATAE